MTQRVKNREKGPQPHEMEAASSWILLDHT